MSAETSDSDILSSDLPKHYELLGKVRSGGMGAIYKARNLQTKQFCAIKVLRPEAAHDPETRKRFTIEAKAARSVKNPNICQVYDFGVTDSQTMFLVMEWIDGISLEEKVRRDGLCSDSETVNIFLQISSALGHVHGRNIVHRDLKPDNIMLTRDRKSGVTQVHLVDFGIAKVLHGPNSVPSMDGLTRAGTIVGTPTYMSPEQARGVAVDPRSDIYSLGCVMYFAISGHPPFMGNSYMDVLYHHLHSHPPEFAADLAVPAALTSVMLKCMEKKLEDRYQSMDELTADLKRLTKGVAIERKILARDREQIRGRVKWILQFVAVFAAVYALSLFMQNVFPTGVTADVKTAPDPLVVKKNTRQH
jgi:eukaryotic-like serine/threonine-protein kinase